MAIKGSLDAVERFQIRGWAYDTENPASAIVVGLFRADDPIATITADLYREDLEKSGIGPDGCHAFIANLDAPLEEADLPRVSAKIVAAGGEVHVLSPEVARAVRAGNRPAAEPAPASDTIPLPESFFDGTQRPLFILGAARSGTSAIAQALLKLGIFEGNEEGHIFDGLAHLSVALSRFYETKYDERTASRNTTVATVPAEYFQEHLDAIFIDLAGRLFSGARWLDKTPNSNMVYLAPRFKKIWPSSRFIFMRRRFLENAMSRSRKFPEFDFERNCREWSDAMGAWLQVRTELRGSAIEIDQKFLGENPDQVADRVAEFLELGEVETRRLSQALRYDRPERTGEGSGGDCELADLRWTEAQLRCFGQYCQNLMDEFGYSTDRAYFRDDGQDRGLVVL